MVKYLFSKDYLIYARTLKNYAKMVSVRDEQTSFHCERVAFNAFWLGKEIGLDHQRLQALYWSGLLHDLGQIGIKEEILLKPGKLTETEFSEIKRHTQIPIRMGGTLMELWDIEEHKDIYFDSKLVDILKLSYQGEDIWVLNKTMKNRDIEIPEKFII